MLNLLHLELIKILVVLGKATVEVPGVGAIVLGKATKEVPGIGAIVVGKATIELAGLLERPS